MKTAIAISPMMRNVLSVAKIPPAAVKASQMARIAPRIIPMIRPMYSVCAQRPWQATVVPDAPVRDWALRAAWHTWPGRRWSQTRNSGHVMTAGHFVVVTHRDPKVNGSRRSACVQPLVTPEETANICGHYVTGGSLSRRVILLTQAPGKAVVAVAAGSAPKVLMSSGQARQRWPARHPGCKASVAGRP